MILEPDSIHVWLAHEREIHEPALLRDFAAMLEPHEKERSNRRYFEQDRHTFLITRALQRSVLSQYAPEVAPADWRFIASEQGKPSLAPQFAGLGLHFNISHAAGLVAMVVGRCARLGIDVERLDKRMPLAVAQRHFSPLEAQQLHELVPEDQPRRFLRLWTLKEAYLKAIGTGIAGGLGRTTFEFDAGQIRFAHDSEPGASEPGTACFAFCQYQIGEEHLLAVAVAADDVTRAAPRIIWQEFPLGRDGSTGASMPRPILLGEKQGAEP